MKKFILCLVLVVPVFAVAQEAGVGEMLDGGVAAVVEAVDAGVVAAPPALADGGAPTSLEDPTALVQVVFKSVVAGDWWAAASALLVLIVALLRKYGQKLRDALDDKNPLDKALWFIFSTKAGGWLLNLVTSVAGGMGTALLAGAPVNWALVKPILLVSITAASLWELVKDVMALFKKTPPPAA